MVKTVACSRCGEVLAVTAFAVDRAKASGLKSWCRDCDNARCRKYYAANRSARIAAVKARNAAKGLRKCRSCDEPATSQRHHYCDACRAARKRHRDRERERTRESTRPGRIERGYGWEHQKLRKQWQRVIDSEPVACARCGDWISPDEPWDLGHDDLDRSRYNGPEHRACNRRTASHKVHRAISRSW